MKKVLQISVLSASIAFGMQAVAGGFVTIGTGGQSGVYYAVGQSVCKLAVRDGLGCNAPSTGGSVDNLNAIAAGERQMGVVQSDSQYRAYHGKGEFEGKKNEKLRAVFAIHPEAFTVVARKEAAASNFADLAGKRINIGNPGSGTRTTMETLLQQMGWDKSKFSITAELQPAEMASALCDNNLDAISYVVGHPSGAIQEAAASCASNLVNVSGEAVDKILAEFPYFSAVTIPAGTYEGTPDAVKTFGVSAVLVSSSDVADDDVYAVVKAVFENFERFKKLHPAFANLEPKDMIENAKSSPLHEGAKRYYQEKGWL